MREYDGFATAASAETRSRLGRLPSRSISQVFSPCDLREAILSMPHLPHQTLRGGNGYVPASERIPPPLLATDEAGPLALELVVGVVTAPIAAGDLHPPPNRKVPTP